MVPTHVSYELHFAFRTVEELISGPPLLKQHEKGPYTVIQEGYDMGESQDHAYEQDILIPGSYPMDSCDMAHVEHYQKVVDVIHACLSLLPRFRDLEIPTQSHFLDKVTMYRQLREATGQPDNVVEEVQRQMVGEWQSVGTSVCIPQIINYRTGTDSG